MHICGKSSLIISSSDSSPQNSLFILKDVPFQWEMHLDPSKLTSAPVCSSQGGLFCREALVPSSHFQMDLFKFLVLQTKRLLKLCVVESGKKKKKITPLFCLPE